MPTIARETAEGVLRRFEVWKLNLPSINLQLGDKFLSTRLNRPEINNNNLLFALSAYNAGEASLSNRCVRSDPLLFAEAIHFRETRIYVKHVLLDLWAYRERLGQKSPSLTTLAADRWPIYVRHDPQTYR